MSKVKFIFKEKEHILEVPEHLVIICEMSNELARYEIEKRKTYPEKDFMEMFLNEEDEISDRGYTFLINELVEIFCKSIGINSERITIDLLNSTEFDIVAEVTDMEDIDKVIESYRS